MSVDVPMLPRPRFTLLYRVVQCIVRYLKGCPSKIGTGLLPWQVSCSLNRARPLQNSCHLGSPYPPDRHRLSEEGRAVVAELGLGFRGEAGERSPGRERPVLDAP